MIQKRNLIYLKIFGIVLIALFLLIPAQMIESIIHERQKTQNESIEEVSSKWANEQTITGPVLSIPYYKYPKNNVNLDTINKSNLLQNYIHILPEELNINGNVSPEMRYRGIFEIVVYNSKIKVSGKFSKSSLQNLGINPSTIDLSAAVLTVGISDLRGIEKQVAVKWNNKNFAFNSGVPVKEVISNGISSYVKIDKDTTEDYYFSFDIDLMGSQKIYFTPVGKVTDINIESSWKNPSFNGAFLPDKREVTANGFKSNWNILHLNRNYPQWWLGDAYNINKSAFGVDLIMPVDNYLKAIRSLKYAILIIGFTFIVFFFIEILNKIYLHPIQYILVGIALIVFYTLLVSISEHSDFNTAFIISAVSTIALIFGYLKAIMKSGKLAGLMASLLLLVYSFIFVIIQLQDLALLIGSIGIFILLAVIMYYSRKIDWYNLNISIDKSTKIEEKINNEINQMRD